MDLLILCLVLGLFGITAVCSVVGLTAYYADDDDTVNWCAAGGNFCFGLAIIVCAVYSRIPLDGENYYAYVVPGVFVTAGIVFAIVQCVRVLRGRTVVS